MSSSYYGSRMDDRIDDNKDVIISMLPFIKSEMEIEINKRKNKKGTNKGKVLVSGIPNLPSCTFCSSTIATTMNNINIFMDNKDKKSNNLVCHYLSIFSIPPLNAFYNLNFDRRTTKETSTTFLSSTSRTRRRRRQTHLSPNFLTVFFRFLKMLVTFIIFFSIVFTFCFPESEYKGHQNGNGKFVENKTKKLSLLSLPSKYMSSLFSSSPFFVTAAADPDFYSVTSFDLDMTIGLLTLHFPVEMRQLSLNASTIILQSKWRKTEFNSAKQYRLTGNQIVGEDYNSTELHIGLMNEDYYNLQLLGFCSSKDNTYLLHDPGLAKSVLGVEVEERINGINALQVDLYNADKLPPFLQSFSLDMNEGKLNITFNEPVDMTTFDPTGLILQEERDKIYDDEWIQYQMLDFNHYRFVAEGCNVTGITTKHYNVVHDIHRNQTFPYNLYGDLEGVDRNFTVSWTDVPHNFTYQIDANITYSTIVKDMQGYGFTVHIDIGPYNLNGIKKEMPLATKPELTYLSADSMLIKDRAGNAMTLATTSDYLAIPVSKFIPDQQPPYLKSFILDMNLGKIYLKLSEIVNPMKQNLTNVCLQNTVSYNKTLGNFATSITNTSSFNATTNTTIWNVETIEGQYQFCLSPDIGTSPWGSIDSSTGEAIVTITFTEEDLIEIKMARKDNIFTSTTNTYLSAPSSFQVDTAASEYSMIEINDQAAMQAEEIISDTGKPTLLSWVLDMDLARIKMLFSEPVNADTVSLDAIQLQQSYNPGKNGKKLNLDPTSTNITQDGDTLLLDIGYDDFTKIKINYPLATLIDYSYLSFMGHAIYDTANPSPNEIVPVRESVGIQAEQYIADKTPPLVLQWDLDLSKNEISFEFSEYIASESFVISGLTLWFPSSTSQYSYWLDSYNLVDSFVIDDVSKTYGRFLVISLGERDQEILRSKPGLGENGNHDDIWIELQENTVYDLNNGLIDNGNTHSDLVQIRNYLVDNQGPYLEEWSINMNDGLVRLEFNEPVQSRTVNCSKLTLAADSHTLTILNLTSSSPSINITLSEQCSVKGNNNTHVIEILPFFKDMNFFRSTPALEKSHASVLLSMEGEFVEDTSGNSNIALPFPENATQVKFYLEDQSSPELLSWDYFHTGSTAHMVLYFSEPISKEISSGNFDRPKQRINRLKIQALWSQLNLPYLTLSNGGYLIDSSSYMSNDTNAITITLPSNDSTYLWQNRPRLAYDQANTYLTMKSNAFEDLSTDMTTLAEKPNPCSAVEEGEGLRVGPVLTMWDLDMEEGVFYLTFSRPVDVSTFDIRGITVLGEAASSTEDEHLGEEDGVDFLTMTPASSFTLTGSGTGGSVVSVQNTDDHVIQINLSDDDINSIKLLETLCINKETSFLAIADGTVLDTSSKQYKNNIISIDDPLPCNAYEADISGPKIKQFDLDLNIGTVTITFDEPVRASSSHISLLGLNRTDTREEDLFYFSDNSITNSENGMTIVIEIEKGAVNGMDLDRLKKWLIQDESDVTSLSDYAQVKLFALENLVQDLSLNANPSEEKVHTEAILVNGLTYDTTSPSLESFDVDMDLGILTLVFDEVVNSSTLKVDSIFFQAYDDSMHVEFTANLTTSSYVINQNELVNIIFVQISKDDRVEIGFSYPVATSANTTFLSMRNGAIMDLAGGYSSFNYFPGTFAKPVSTFIQDYTGPYALKFDFNIEDRNMEIYFDEVVDAGKFDVTGVTIQARNFVGNNVEAKYRLTREGSTVQTEGFATSIFIEMSKAEIDAIKEKPVSIGTSAGDPLSADINSTTWLILDESTISDLNGNELHRIVEGSALNVTSFTPDTTSPYVVGFSLYADENLLLYFSEPILVATVNVTAFTFTNASRSVNFTLTERSIVTTEKYSHSSVVTIDLSGEYYVYDEHGVGTRDADAFEIENIEFLKPFGVKSPGGLAHLRDEKTYQGDLAYKQRETWLLVESFGCKDTSGNSLSANEDGIMMGPAVESFVIDMEENYMNVTFNLPVYGSNGPYGFDATAISLQHYDYTDNVTVQLSPSVTVIPSNGTTHQIYFSDTDVRNIKLGQHGICNYEQHCHLSVSDKGSKLAYSMQQRAINSPTYVRETSSTDALKATKVLPDTTRPELNSYLLDMDSNRLQLFFSEPVLFSSVDPREMTLYGNENLEPYCELTTEPMESSYYSYDSLLFDLEDEDINCIEVNGVGKYMTMTEDAAKDVSRLHNPVVPIDFENPMEASSVITDISWPELASGVLDLDSGFLSLTFSKVIDMTQTNIEKFALKIKQIHTDNSVKFQNLTTSSITFSIGEISPNIDLKFGISDYAAIQSFMALERSKDTVKSNVFTNMTSVYMQEGAVIDFAMDKWNRYSFDKGVTEIIQDTTEPSLISYELNTHNSGNGGTYGKLSLYFDEAVDASSLDVSKISLSANSDMSSATTLSGASSVTIPSSGYERHVEITLTAGDLATLNGKGISSNNQLSSRLTLGSGAISDIAIVPNILNTNTISSVNPLQMGPVLHRFSLDMNQEFIFLVFSRPMNIGTYNESAFMLVNNGTYQNHAKVIRFANTTIEDVSGTGEILKVYLGTDMIHAIQTSGNIGRSLADTKLAVDEGAIYDTYGGSIMSVVPISINSPLECYNYNEDRVHPKITYLSLDLDSGYFNVTFDEYMDFYASDVSYSIFQSARSYNFSDEDRKTTQVRLTSLAENPEGGSQVINSDLFGYTVSILLGNDDLNAIKWDAQIGNNETATWYTTVRDSFYDAQGLTAWSILPDQARKVEKVINDSTNPNLLSFDLDMDAGYLYLHFDESVNNHTLDAFAHPNSLSSTGVGQIGSGIQIMQYADSGDANFISLNTPSSIESMNSGSTLKWKINSTDFMEINRLENLANTPDETFLLISNGTIKDMAGNPLNGIGDGSALLVNRYIPDTTHPTVYNYTIDMNTGELVLFFDEPILSSSFDPSYIIFESLQKSCFYYYQSGVKVSSCSDSEWQDYKSYTLTTNSILKTMASTGEEEDETVTSLDSSGELNKYVNNNIVTILIGNYDLNAIKNIAGLAISKETCNLQILPSAFTDMTGNLVNQVGGLLPSFDPSITSRGLPAGIYIPDASRPALNRFKLDMDKGLLLLNFTETIDITNYSFNISGINLHSHPKLLKGRNFYLNQNVKEIKLGSGGFANLVLIYLSTSDLNWMKVNGLGKYDMVRSNGHGIYNSVYITISKGSFRDFNGNPVLPVLDEDILGVSATKVLQLYSDVTGPILSKFFIEDDKKQLRLHFNEAVNISSIDGAKLSLIAPYPTSTVRSTCASCVILSDESNADEGLIVFDISQGAPSLWDTLNYNDIDRQLHISLAMEEDFIFDLAVEPNGNSLISSYYAITESRTSCSCSNPVGGNIEEYIISLCTTTEDATCGKCTSCSDEHYDHYTLFPCSLHADAQCARCSKCRYPYYQAAPCEGTTDTKCAYCTPCGSDEYEAAPCTPTSDRICSSCKTCNFLSEASLKGCKESSITWREENCCEDSEGTKRHCFDLTMAEFEIDAIDGKRNWVFDTTIPNIIGHRQWTGNYYDWYLHNQAQANVAAGIL